MQLLPFVVFWVTLLAGCAATPERPRGTRKTTEPAGLARAQEHAAAKLEARQPPTPEPEPEPVPSGPLDARSRYRPGDFAPPNALLVAYDDEWEEPMIELIDAARQEVDVYVLAAPEELSNYRFFAWLARHDADVVVAAHDTPWVRDFGPMQVFDALGRVVWLDFNYSTERLQDDTSPIEVATHMGMPIEEHRWWLDGGAVLSNGRGLCVITDNSLGSVGLVSDDAEDRAEFLKALGCRELAVVPALPGEETGHADLIAQFLGEGVVAISEADPHEAPRTAQALESAVRIISESAAALEQPLEIVRTPLRVRGRRFYSYVNATRLPGKLLVPRYVATPDLERRAYGVLSSALPGIGLVPVVSDAMIARGGAIHCVTLGLNLLRRDRRLAHAPRRWIGAANGARF